MRTPNIWMWIAAVVVAALVTGCQPKPKEPVAVAPPQQPAPEPFPEAQVPPPEPQPAQAEAPPVDTAVTSPKVAKSATPGPKPEPKESYAPSPKAKNAKSYVVKKGDTLQKISKQFYGTTKQWRRIADANRKVLGKDPDKLKVGTKLVIP